MRLSIPVLAIGTTLVVSCGQSSTPTPPPTEPPSTPPPSTPPPSTPPPPSPTPTPPPPPTGPAPGEASLLGTWTSRSCGARRYVRNVTIESGGRIRGEERVSPCPPTVACVWSGIVMWQGTWRTDGNRILITPDAEASRNTMGPPPTLLHWDTATSAITEVAPGASCTYTR